MTFTPLRRHPGGDDLSASVASSVVRSASVTSLDARRLAVAAALRAVRDEPPPPRRTSPELAALQAEVRRLASRLERVEDTIELMRDDAEPPLHWPTPVSTDSPLEVPPLEISRRSSPAFDILLGPSPSQSTSDEARDSA